MQTLERSVYRFYVIPVSIYLLKVSEIIRTLLYYFTDSEQLFKLTKKCLNDLFKVCIMIFPKKPFQSRHRNDRTYLAYKEFAHSTHSIARKKTVLRLPAQIPRKSLFYNTDTLIKRYSTRPVQSLYNSV